MILSLCSVKVSFSEIKYKKILMYLEILELQWAREDAVAMRHMGNETDWGAADLHLSSHCPLQTVGKIAHNIKKYIYIFFSSKLI